MGKTFKTNLERKVRKFNKAYHAKVAELGITGTFPASDVNPELNAMIKGLRKDQQKLGDPCKLERRHSAAHRHSAKKTRKRCGRMNKHSEKREAIEIALDARQKPIKVTA